LRTESMFREKNEDLQPCGIETIKLRTVKWEGRRQRVFHFSHLDIAVASFSFLFCFWRRRKEFWTIKSEGNKVSMYLRVKKLRRGLK
jgi:hypothetical protein